MIKTLARCVRDAVLPAILTPILVLCEALIEVTIPTIMGKMIDLGITPAIWTR